MSKFPLHNHQNQSDRPRDQSEETKQLTIRVGCDILDRIKNQKDWESFVQEMRAHQQALSCEVPSPAITTEAESIILDSNGNTLSDLSQAKLLDNHKTVILPKTSPLKKKPIGALLREAGLISAPQIEVALRDQAMRSDLRLGDILALRGWLDQRTTDFFADQWPALLKQKRRRLGYYLMKAALLDIEQIRAILAEQQHDETWIRFGTLAVLKGWLKPQTRDFFIKYLAAEDTSADLFKKRCSEQTLVIFQ